MASSREGAMRNSEILSHNAKERRRCSYERKACSSLRSFGLPTGTVGLPAALSLRRQLACSVCPSPLSGEVPSVCREVEAAASRQDAAVAHSRGDCLRG